jgi:hypothetical protein
MRSAGFPVGRIFRYQRVWMKLAAVSLFNAAAPDVHAENAKMEQPVTAAERN